VPAQNTGMGPEKTSFFQALSIPTKITKGTIEIISDVPLIKAGDRVSFRRGKVIATFSHKNIKKFVIKSQNPGSGSVFSLDCQIRTL
jgi:large subunit ribosomal protein LP0